MKLLRALVAAALLAMLVSGLMPVGLNPISPAHLTKGKSTLYEFSFVLDRNVSQPATVDIGFPAEYNYTVLASQLTCYYRTNLTSWAIKPCSLIKYKSNAIGQQEGSRAGRTDQRWNEHGIDRWSTQPHWLQHVINVHDGRLQQSSACG